MYIALGKGLQKESRIHEYKDWVTGFAGFGIEHITAGGNLGTKLSVENEVSGIYVCRCSYYR